MQEKKKPPRQVVATTTAAVIDPMVADIAMAKAWYEKARDLGSAEAAVRLKRLTNGRSPRR
jgi:hypothetical protein